MKDWTLTQVTVSVYALCLVLMVFCAMAGKLGSLDLATSIGWVLSGWLAGYATIVVMLVGGTIHSIMKTLKNYAEESGV